MTYARSFRLDRLYHKFLKPKGLPLEKLYDLAEALELAGFIVTGGESEISHDRYIETEKLTSGLHKKELFKIIQRLTHETSETA